MRIDSAEFAEMSINNAHADFWMTCMKATTIIMFSPEGGSLHRHCMPRRLKMQVHEICAGTGMQVVVFGGHTSESGWFSRRQEVYHSDIVVLERQGSVSWQRPAVTGPPPAAREFHTLTPVSPTKFLLLGGECCAYHVECFDLLVCLLIEDGTTMVASSRAGPIDVEIAPHPRVLWKKRESCHRELPKLMPHVRQHSRS